MTTISLTLPTRPPTARLATYPPRMAANAGLHESSLDDRFADGAAESLREAFDRHGATVYTYCRRTLPADQAQEAAQDVFVSAWRNHHRYHPERGPLVAWLLGIARHRVIDRARAEQRHLSRRSATDVADRPETLAPADDATDELADRLVVADALRHLPERAQRCLRLHFLDGFTHDEIAHRTGVPLGTVKSDIRRGLDRLRRHLEGDHG